MPIKEAETFTEGHFSTIYCPDKNHSLPLIEELLGPEFASASHYEPLTMYVYTPVLDDKTLKKLNDKYMVHRDVECIKCSSPPFPLCVKTP